MRTKSYFTLYQAIGLIIAIIVSKFAQDSTLNKLSVVSAIGIDKNKTGYTTSLQIFNPAANTKEGADIIGAYTVTAQGKTISDAIDHISNKLSRKIFLDSTQVAVIGESLANSEGLSSITNFFLRESTLPSNIRFVITKGVKPEKMLQIFTPDQKVSGSRLEEMLQRKRDAWGEVSDITSDKIKGRLSQNRTELAIPYITVKGDISKGVSKENIGKASPDALLAIDGLAVFKNQRLSYWLSSRESNLYTLTHEKIQNTTLITKCEKQSGYVKWKNVESKPDIKIQEEKGHPAFILQLKMKGKLSDLSCNIDTSTVEAVSTLEKAAERDLQKQINQLIAKTQNNKTDIVGFGEAMYRKQPEMWNRLKSKWGSEYLTAPIRTNLSFDILEPGEAHSH